MKILILNGSLGGENGNTQVLINAATQYITKHNIEFEIIHLEQLDKNPINLKNKLTSANGFIFTSGTYWDSWGSPMQKFLEESTEFEASDVFFNKPASVMITMHSVGGKGVLSRLQGVLNTIGLAIPPMSGLVYSLSAHLAINQATNLKEDSTFNEDFWSLEDIEVVIHNLITYMLHKKDYKSWPVDHKDPKRRWL